MLREDSRYKPKRFIQQLREVSPEAYKQYLKTTQGNGRYVKLYDNCDRLHIEYKIRKGKVFYWVYSKGGKVITSGVEK